MNYYTVSPAFEDLTDTARNASAASTGLRTQTPSREASATPTAHCAAHENSTAAAI
jgi:hypothetical protein